MNFELPKLTFTSEVSDLDSPDIDINAINRLVHNGWHITTVHPPLFNLKANNDDTICLLCKRVHEH